MDLHKLCYFVGSVSCQFWHIITDTLEENMNHSERIAYAARQHYGITRLMAEAAIESYFEKLAEEIASGEWVNLYGIGKIQVGREQGAGTLQPFTSGGKRTSTKVGMRLRTRIRLYEAFKQRRHDADS
jgi:nucleoid DNA-binding protein